MTKVLDLLNTVESKVVALKDKRDNLLVEIDLLTDEQIEMKLALQEKNQSLNDLKERVKMLEMANSLKGEGESNTAVKLKVNELVREIDKCIALLNK